MTSQASPGFLRPRSTAGAYSLLRVSKQSMVLESLQSHLLRCGKPSQWNMGLSMASKLRTPTSKIVQAQVLRARPLDMLVVKGVDSYSS
jgi:hypothetical protein